jgi:hypothetical protein
VGAAKTIVNEVASAAPPLPSAGAHTPGQEQTRRSITRTTVTPAPTDHGESSEEKRRRLALLRERAKRRPELTAAVEPLPGTNILRLVMTMMLAALCLLSIGGAVLVLLLWQQEQDSGVLTTQIDRTWEIFGYLRDVERWVAMLVVPVAVAWIGLATLNVGRATGQARSVVVAAASLPFGALGVWYIGSGIVAQADGTMARASGIALQAVFVAVPLLALERVVEAADARHRPLRVTFLAAVAYLAVLQGLDGLSTTEVTRDPEEWGRLGSYLVISALILVLGALAANEAARSIEEATDHRYQLRHRFGEALLGQAATRLG